MLEHARSPLLQGNTIGGLKKLCNVAPSYQGMRFTVMPSTRNFKFTTFKHIYVFYGHKIPCDRKKIFHKKYFPIRGGISKS